MTSGRCVLFFADLFLIIILILSARWRPLITYCILCCLSTGLQRKNCFKHQI